ncbi:MAG: hypothetical protein QOI73_2016 [Solirubrobacteraceae bacterium]|nr:hypothetical protein [Solirubrobacteraceae bacterium]
MRWPLPSALLALACSLILAAPAGAQTAAGSKTVSLGTVSATLSWQAGGDYVATEPRLRIVRAGATVLDAPLDQECMLCNGVADPESAVGLVDLDADGEPEVLVDLYTGGAHCCSTTLIWYLKSQSAQDYGRRVASWGNQGHRVKDLDGDGRPELISADDRFAYTYTAFAFSWFPPLVYDWRDQALVDATRRFPKVVRADLAAIRKALPGARRDGDPRGLIAAYVADEFLLGHRRAALRYLARALRRGDLRPVPDGDTTWPAGRRFKPALLRFLKRHRY